MKILKEVDLNTRIADIYTEMNRLYDVIHNEMENLVQRIDARGKEDVYITRDSIKYQVTQLNLAIRKLHDGYILLYQVLEMSEQLK